MIAKLKINSALDEQVTSLLHEMYVPFIKKELPAYTVLIFNDSTRNQAISLITEHFGDGAILAL